MVIISARGNQSGPAAGVRQGIISASAHGAHNDFMPLIVRRLTERRKGTGGIRLRLVHPSAARTDLPGRVPSPRPGLHDDPPRPRPTPPPHPPQGPPPNPPPPPPPPPSPPHQPSRAIRPMSDPCHPQG